MAKATRTTLFWYWVYRWSGRLNDYAEKIADTRYAKECNIEVVK